MFGKLRRQRRSTATLVSGLAVIVAIGVAVAPATAGPPSGPGPGNSPNAKACQQNGWTTLVREDATGFANEGECTSYAAQGGALFNANEAPCLNGGYVNYVTSAGQSFSDQAACVSYVRGGGQLQPKPTVRTAQQICEDAGGTFEAGGTGSSGQSLVWSCQLPVGFDSAVVPALADACLAEGGSGITISGANRHRVQCHT